ncbi:MAG: Crp/Fnr family transcriptional regulator, partial [Acidimicrobiia bacterium]
MAGVRIDPPFDREVSGALGMSHLRGLTDDDLALVMAGARCRRIEAGRTLHREGETAAHCEMVVSGLIRVYVVAPDGRTMTIRYCRRGALIGVASLFEPSFTLPATIQAITDCEVLQMVPSSLKRAALNRSDVAGALLAELSERAMTFVAEIPGGAFATIRQRLARHLLDLASGAQHGPELVARIGQQDLADAVGSVREVVVRALRELRQEGLVETGRGKVVILDPD